MYAIQASLLWDQSQERVAPTCSGLQRPHLAKVTRTITCKILLGLTWMYILYPGVLGV